MPTLTTNYSLNKPNVNSADDEDLWGGQLNDNMDTLDTQLKAVSDVANTGQLPVGSLYFNASDGTNPATLLGYGTWSAFAEGRIPIGVGTGTDDNAVDQTFNAEDEAGEYTHTLTTSEMPAHTHNNGVGDDGGNDPFIYSTTSDDVPGNQTTTPQENVRTATKQGLTSSTGDDGAHNNMPPTIAVYIWKRTA